MGISGCAITFVILGAARRRTLRRLAQSKDLLSLAASHLIALVILRRGVLRPRRTPNEGAMHFARLLYRSEREAHGKNSIVISRVKVSCCDLESATHIQPQSPAYVKIAE